MALALSVGLLGCGGGGGDSSAGGGSSSGGTSSGGSSSGGMVDTQAPTISNPRLSPTTLDFRGGVVTISAEVTDASGISSVIATVQGPGGSTETVELAQTTGTTYSATWGASANSSTTASVTYTVSVRATDTRGNVSPNHAAGTLTVLPPDPGDTVPPPPVFPD
ncbi:MAG TPA: hypothetical protein GX715_04190 [Armatimonadetes bacterium]|nr:hypothetical protein [Armatimonadota bacterium]